MTTSKKSSDMLIGFGMSVPLFGIVMIFVFIFYDGEDSGGGSSSSQSSSSPSSSHSEPFLSGSMDGHAWNAASSGSKQALAADISRRLREEGVADVSSGFIYSAVNSFYGSNDSSVLNTSISEVVGLSVAASQ